MVSVYSQRMKKLMILLVVALMATAACSSSTPETELATSAAPSSDGGGGSTDALSLVVGSADQADQVGSYKMQFTMTMSGMGDLMAAGGGAGMPSGSGDTVDFMTGSAEVDAANDAMHMTAEVFFVGEMEVITIDGKTYISSPMLASLGGGREGQWMETPADASATSGTSSDPTAFLETLRGVGSVQEVGSETIDGQETKHYTATVDLEAALAQLPEDEAGGTEEALSAFQDQFGASTFPIDVWLNGEGLPVKVEFSFEFDASAFGGTSGGTAPNPKLTMVMTMSDYGVPVDIQAPPAGQVVPMPTGEGMPPVG